MAGDEPTVLPLRASDPARIGTYRLLGRLGEGGMGTVYLAMGEAGRMVALKMIRLDRAGNDEFRRRFRGEVKRARQVPPFCTAEVVDADPDHDPPYLVVEYVDGPSLAAVVEERGPLTPANLHGLAIGVATALTAIHGAGVIHRDLKPSNVLLPPGSPKVIDFGIARAVQGTDVGTSTGTVIGTVAYMAPERFDAVADGTLTPAADVFAWGAVVSFAGTGRTPFGGDSPEITAVRIMTQPPDLSGLSGHLKDLVEQALAKNPADRPTARELLDDLLSGASRRPRELAVALARQPDLLVAAEKAQAATDHHRVAETALAVADPAPTAADDDATAVDPAATTVDPAVTVPTRSADATVAARPADGAPTVALPYPRRPVDDPPPAPPVDRWSRVNTVLLLLLVLLAAVAGAGYATGVLPIQRASGGNDDGTAPPPTPSTVVNSQPTLGPAPATFKQQFADPLTSSYYFKAKDDAPSGLGSCRFDDAFVVTTPNFNSYRCQGPQDYFMNARIDVDVRLLAPDSCAAIWFRYKLANGGYAARFCPDRVYVLTHGVIGARDVLVLRDFPYPDQRTVAVDEPVRIGVEFVDDDLWVRLDEVPFGRMPLSASVPAEASEPLTGRIHLGIFPFSGEGTAPFSVAFTDVRLSVPE